MKNKRIGIIDSGVGGLTVVQELRKIMPEENILYLGDNINVPYGNKSEEEIYSLTKILIDYLIDQEVKLIAIACNTISSIIDDYFGHIEIPIVSIIEPVSKEISKEKSNTSVGLLGTNFTISAGLYENLICEKNESISLIPEPCPSLAKVIDDAEFSYRELEEIVDLHLNNLRKKDGGVRDIILGCTHYPIIKDIFYERGVDFNFIDPAKAQVEEIYRILRNKNLLADTKDRASLEIKTTASEKVYKKIIQYLNMDYVDSIERIEL